LFISFFALSLSLSLFFFNFRFDHFFLDPSFLHLSVCFEKKSMQEEEEGESVSTSLSSTNLRNALSRMEEEATVLKSWLTQEKQKVSTSYIQCILVYLTFWSKNPKHNERILDCRSRVNDVFLLLWGHKCGINVGQMDHNGTIIAHAVMRTCFISHIFGGFHC
jgi:hypothetical protein